VVLALVPLAEASPPDQTWIAGVYDNADHDDAVILVTASAASLRLGPPADASLSRTVVAFVRHVDERVRAAVVLLSNHVRPPPAA